MVDNTFLQMIRLMRTRIQPLQKIRIAMEVPIMPLNIHFLLERVSNLDVKFFPGEVKIVTINILLGTHPKISMCTEYLLETKSDTVGILKQYQPSQGSLALKKLSFFLLRTAKGSDALYKAVVQATDLVTF